MGRTLTRTAGAVNGRSTDCLGGTWYCYVVPTRRTEDNQHIVLRARTFASQAHWHIDHRRKYSNQPSEAHLKGVAELVRSVTNDPEFPRMFATGSG